MKSDIQNKIINYPLNENLLILSLPGGGKTTTLINRVNFLIKEKNINQDKILIITFTNSAVDDIKSKININNIFTIDSLCSKLCQKYNILDKNLFSINEPNDYKYELLKNISLIKKKEWDYIFIDEVQDIDHIQYLIIKHFNDLSINLYLTGDINQNIYNFRGTSNKYILQYEKYFSNITKIILDINYRSTKYIIDMLNDVEQNMNTNKSIFSNLLNLNKKKLIEFKKVENYSEEIIYQINKNKYNVKKCCIISKNNEMINIIYNELFKYKKFRDIQYITIHSSKGLQYDHLFFVDVNDGIIPFYKSNNIKEDERLYYVAISRAAVSINIMYHKKPSRFLFYHKEFLLLEDSKEKPKYKNIKCNEIDSNLIIQKMEKYYQFRKNELSKFEIKSESLQSIKIPTFIQKNDLMIEFNTFLYLLISRITIEHKKILSLKEFEFKFKGISEFIDHYLDLSQKKLDISKIFIIACVLVYKENKKRLKGYLLYNNQKLLIKKDLKIIEKIFDITKTNTVNIFYKNSNIQEYLFQLDNIYEQIIIDIINWKLIFINYSKEFK